MDLADPRPERRLARLLGAFIAVGLVFLVLPGTLLGVWNLVGITSRRAAGAVPPSWIQAHGHAQLFGWVATFMIGISLYTFPKFRGASVRSLPAGWAMLGLWAAAVAARWASALWDWHWRLLWPAAAVLELLVALLLIWQCSGSARARRAAAPWDVLVFAGFGGLAATLAWQLFLVCRPLSAPLVPEPQNRVLLAIALWWFCFPVAWGYSLRLLPVFLGLRSPDAKAVYIGLSLLPIGLFLSAATLLSVLLACWSLRIFHPQARPAKTAGAHPRYPLFARFAFGWLIVAAALQLGGSSRGITGASRHAFTVGFLATLIFSLGPRMLPSFLNSRELWSPRLMFWSLAVLTAGCTLRVISEPFAYAEALPAAWTVLPISAVLELGAVVMFAWNIAATLLTPMPAWVLPRSINENLELYWYVTAYPGTRRLLAKAGLKAAERGKEVPRSLTLRQAAEAEGVDWRPLVSLLREFFTARVARALREKP